MVYIPDDGAAITSDPTVQAMNAVLDVSAASEFEVKVGYANKAPMIPILYSNDAAGALAVSDYSGRIAIRVLNPLVSQATNDQITVTVFARFPHPQFSTPRVTIDSYNTGGVQFTQPFNQAVTYQGKAIGDTPIEAMQVVLVPPSEDLYPCPDVVSGEDIRSMRALAQKPMRIKADSPVIRYGGYTEGFLSYAHYATNVS